MNYIIPYNTIEDKGNPINLDHIVSFHKAENPLTNEYLIKFYPTAHGTYKDVWYYWAYKSENARNQEYKRVISKIDPPEEWTYEYDC